ncbi:MAG: glutamate racemase [Flavobacteriaceae bacterium]|nr:glutamate racemase [Flavobacteriaceae bacterium]
MKNENSIGIFDSGIGGISVWQELNKLLPNENYIYIADKLNAPYGDKSFEFILERATSITKYLISKGVKIIVIACNTATTNVIDILRSKFKVDFIGVEPAIKPAIELSLTKSIAVLATKSTLQSSLYNKTSTAYKKQTLVHTIEGNGLVKLIEANKINSPEMYDLLFSYINNLDKLNVDNLVLGCTHYTFLKPIIRQILGDKINIIDSGKAIANRTKSILIKNKTISQNKISPTHIFITNDDLNGFNSFLNSQNIDSSSVKLNSF